MSSILREPAELPGFRFHDFAPNEPIRAEQYGVEHLESHARQLASAARAAAAADRRLLRRFEHNGRTLLAAHQRIVAVASQQEPLTPAAEWLLDNFHIVEDTLREVRQDLPRGYYDELPKLAEGPYAGLPRVYGLSVELIAHTDSTLDEDAVTRFVRAFQTNSLLTIGELWAVPTMLRMGLLENLCRLATQMLETWDERQKAEAWAAHLLTAESTAGARCAPAEGWSDPCLVHLLGTLRDRGPAASPCVEWLEDVLAGRGISYAEVLRREHQRLAANQVSVGNCVTCLRLLSNLDWGVFFERTSLVEAALRDDPAGTYARQDFATKDRYRRAVEALARGSARGELEVARRALEMAQGGLREQSSSEGSRNLPTSHVGYYLVGPGRVALETDLDYRAPPGERILRAILGRPEAFYFVSLVAVVGLILTAILAYASSAGASWPMLLLVLAAALLPASEWAVGLVHYLITLVLPPRVLPKLDFKDGIPPDCATFVVMPTMLLRPESAAALAERLEVHYLSNPDPQLRFALLTDFADASAEHEDGDEEYVRLALERIQELNARYPLPADPAPSGDTVAAGPDRFFLFHRRRLWNPVQGCWMGWERKRGKLAEFNRLLRGAHDTSFSVVSGDLAQLPPVRFVITLDADTGLPLETARRLVGTLAHPLNRPHFDPARGRVVAGYGVLQPRVSLSLVAGTRSLFARVLASSAGLDPYTTAVSDVYQDLFGRGTFTGKGIYDLDAFEASTGQAFPDNHILSHDLIEGNFARCGLVTDVELLDDFPAGYNAYARREHRWVRGDWQILPWLFRRVPTGTVRSQLPAIKEGESKTESNGLRANPLPALERWKIFDNLRRSLVPPALVALFVLGWTVLPGSPWLWTALGLAVLALPLVLSLAGLVVASLRTVSLRLPLREVRGSLPATAGQAALAAAFLVEQARHSVDAITRTLVRLYVTQRNRLEWEAAASTERRLGTQFQHFLSGMGPAAGLAVLLALGLGYVRPEALPAAALLLASWILAPALAFWVSRPRVTKEGPLTAAERRQLRRLARKTWHFFETFVGSEDHWLPPDNFQEDPKGQVAHRTSPTNVGLYLLSCLVAHDLGYLSLSALAERLEKTFDTFDRLERFHGHFYNWYNTQTLEVLPPVYVSTVDSGNLLGCLVALRQGLREKANASLCGPEVREGLADTLGLIAEAFHAATPRGSEPPEVYRLLAETIYELERIVQENPSGLVNWQRWLERVAHRADELVQWAQDLDRNGDAPAGALHRWIGCLAAQVRDRHDELRDLIPGPGTPETRGWQTPIPLPELKARAQAIEECPPDADLPERLERLAERAADMARAMDFKLLYNEQRHLFSVGYNRTLGRLDSAHYDLLASEASLASFLAIARGDAPRRHWFQLGRQLTRVAGSAALVSWGGTMFEYLMPRLLLRAYPGTLLEESWRAAVDGQIEYGRQARVPWGISESGFGALDAALDYQYQSFGVPGLGLKRGLSRDLVVAPYATALAVMIRPHAAAANFRALAAENAEGVFGFHEAIDYTRDRAQGTRRPVVVRSYMAHHQGMTLAALANALFGDPLPRRFHREPIVRAAELLLQERMPWAAPRVEPHADEAGPLPIVREEHLPVSRHLTTPDTPHPRVHLLSNGHYGVLLTNNGAGSSTWRGLDVTRWREDRTRDCWGQFVYVRDLRTGRVWSAGHQPLATVADRYEVVYSTDKAEFTRRDGDIETHLEITVSPENNAEIRRLTLTNHSSRTRDLEVSSYAEIVLAPHAADLAHPAFGKLFLETEFIAAEEALLCRRRPRAADSPQVWAVHVLAADGPVIGSVQYETDRARFLGRGRTPARPQALDAGAVLSGTTGAVLDPIFSLRRRVRVPPGASAGVAFTTAVAETRDAALALADQYHDYHGVNRAFDLAWAHSQVELRHFHLSAADAHLFQRLAAHVVFAGSTLRAPRAVLAANQRGHSGLWGLGISGDKPIVLVRVAEPEEVGLVRQLLTAHAYWRLRGLEVDLVLLNEHPAGYFEELHQRLQDLVRASDSHPLTDKPGGIFLRRAGTLSEEDRVLLASAARVVLAGGDGTLAAQLTRSERRPPAPPAVREQETRRARKQEGSGSRQGARPYRSSLFANGYGGFSPDGREYVIDLHTPAGPIANQNLHLPPAPWINVVANPGFGFLVSESGAGYTWAGNSQLNRLTPWANDPVSDPPGEVLYLRDEANGAFWTPTPLPRGNAGCVVRHGQGYTVFEQESHGLRQELLLLVPPADPVKVLRLRVRNRGSGRRRLAVVFYAEWVLGTVRDQASAHVVTDYDAASEAVLARNPFNPDFAGHVAFAAAAVPQAGFTADRTEFLGRNGSLANPAALTRVGLAGSVGPALDPCAVLWVTLDLSPGEEKDVTFFLGQATDPSAVRRLLECCRQPGWVEKVLDEVRSGWEGVLGAVQVRTPDLALDLLLNRWLLYQTLACRVWGRSALYQSGGAFGFRDQLQDIMALVYGAPAEARAHLLRAAARQFLEGDVQHWWHPPAGRGVRTRFSDDFLWLPLAVHHYVTATGDAAILDEPVAFLRAPVLHPEQEEDYGLPEVMNETPNLYEHCILAIEHGLRRGVHGLPLMGAGDWNDGMNKVGAAGRGESVWNAWFQNTILRRFAGLARVRGDAARADRFEEEAEHLRAAVEEHAWDGAWYRRAYFDDGTPLGSAQNDECRIDSIAQTWAVISGAADPQRAWQALAAVDEHLVRAAERMVLLFTPPFDQGLLQPGYVKGYVPGIRENGGQYTHAAVWVVLANALLGRGNRAYELFDYLNPIRHAATPVDAARYKVEPYVVAADVYGVPPHTGRGGWTWYTGSAGWLYRVGLEAILGFDLRGDVLRLNPCIPASWPGFTITYRFRSTTYRVTVENPRGVERGVRTVTMDGDEQPAAVVPLRDDGQEHEVRVVMG